jgi:hypothetical protein
MSGKSPHLKPGYSLEFRGCLGFRQELLANQNAERKRSHEERPPCCPAAEIISRVSSLTCPGIFKVLTKIKGIDGYVTTRIDHNYAP